jgi:fructosamine-3-kinase
MLTDAIMTALEAATGRPHQLMAQLNIGGGCINTTMKLDTNVGSYFLKLNRAELLDMFEAEAAGLQELALAGAVRVPRPIDCGVTEGQAWLVMEYIDVGGTGDMALFGQQLAAMHHCTSDRFGWQRDNTIGTTLQSNTWCNNWPEFWREQRLVFQLELARDNGAGARLFEPGMQLAQRGAEFFSDYTPAASVLHGDLWAGNYAIAKSGEAVIYDPAVYFGDREADLAMTELFGGFPPRFYDAYNEAWPLDAGYRVRKVFYNLYHILNHYNLFGGGYADQAESMIRQLLSELR